MRAVANLQSTDMSQPIQLLNINDDPVARSRLEVILNFLGESVRSCSTSDPQVIDSVDDAKSSASCDAVLIGHCQHLELKDLLEALAAVDTGLPVILLGHGAELSLAPGCTQNVIARLPLPVQFQSMLDALHKARVFREHFLRRREFSGVRDYNMFRSLVGTSPQIQRIRRMMGQVAGKEVSVLITGESGTGKEVVARNLHLNSSRAEMPFIPINCGAISRDLLESELFGHEKGAFTGAVAARAGRFELADGGTLFLDEIGDMPLSMQVKLLRVLQERSFERVGGVKTIHTDVRILTATHKNLEAMIASGEFRQDLYYRINVFPIEMPPLRERSEDIPLLLNELIASLEADRRGSVRFNSAAIAALCQYPWPGNVRELANLVERMAILHPNGIVGFNDLPVKFRHDPAGVEASPTKLPEPAIRESSNQTLPLSGLDLREYLATLEKDLIEQALDDCDGVVARAADRLHMRRTTLVEKIRKYSLQKKSVSADDDEPSDDDGAPAELTSPRAVNEG